MIAQKNSILSKIYEISDITALAVCGISALVAILLYFGIYKDLGIYILPVVIAIPLLFLFIKYPIVWIYTIFIVSSFFIIRSSKDLSADDIIFAVIYNIVLYVWFFWHVFVLKEKIVENAGDWTILFFFIICLLNIIIAYLNDVDLLEWFREYMVFSMILLYFPIKKYISEKKDIIALLIILIIISLFCEAYQFQNYYQFTLQRVEYAYQLTQTMRLTQFLFSAASIGGFLFAIYTKNKIFRIFLLLFTLSSLLAVVSTFARTLWFLFAIQVAITFFYFSKQEKIRILSIISVLTVLALAVMLFVFKDNMSIMIGVINSRLSSTTSVRKDMSIQSRVSENKAVYKIISRYPIGGTGMRSEFTFFNPITQITEHRIYIHNGYLYYTYRLGIPLALLFIFHQFFYIFKAEKVMRKLNDPFFKTLTMTCFCFILVVIISNFLSTLLTHRDAMLLYTFSISFISISNKKLIEQTNKELN